MIIESILSGFDRSSNKIEYLQHVIENNDVKLEQKFMLLKYAKNINICPSNLDKLLNSLKEDNLLFHHIKKMAYSSNAEIEITPINGAFP